MDCCEKYLKSNKNFLTFSFYLFLVNEKKNAPLDLNETRLLANAETDSDFDILDSGVAIGQKNQK